MTTELSYLSATEAIAAFKRKELTPVELLEAVITRIESVNGEINAFTYTHFERARQQAKEAERVYLRSPEDARPLEGIPCAIKDWHSVAGEITTYGSRAFRDFRPDLSAPTVERLLNAGAIMHARSTTPEFAHAAVTRSPLWGITRNPWNPEYNAGGSSGGAAAALAAGMTTIADGTDGGGSIRIPASMNGVVGYKPPYGRNPMDHEHPGEFCLHYGPLSRSVADAALMQNVMSGYHPSDIESLRESVHLPEKFEEVEGLRVGVSPDLGYFEISPVVRENTFAAASAFKEIGCSVEEVDLEWGEWVFEAWMTNWEGIFWSLTKDIYTRWRHHMDPYLVKILEAGRERTLPEFYSVNRARYDMYQKLQPLLEQYDVLICPTIAIPSVPADFQEDDPTFEINGRFTHPGYGWFLTYPFNVVSQCPVMSVPSGVDPDTGVPTGLQIVGKTFDDLSVFRAAAAYESVRPWRGNYPGEQR